MADQVPKCPAHSTKRLCLPGRWPGLQFLFALFPIIFWLSAGLALSAAGGTKEKPEFQRAQMLARNICGVCHLFPQPELLDRYTWTNHIKPLMRISMGVAALEDNPTPDARTLMEQWNAI